MVALQLQLIGQSTGTVTASFIPFCISPHTWECKFIIAETRCSKAYTDVYPCSQLPAQLLGTIHACNQQNAEYKESATRFMFHLT